MLPTNPLKRPYLYNDGDAELVKTNKRTYKLATKEKQNMEILPEKRHFLLISSIKSIHSKPMPLLYDYSSKFQSNKSQNIGILDPMSLENLLEKQRLAQHEMELYKEQLAFYSKECCMEPNEDYYIPSDIKRISYNFN